jgi:V8-like Glu-specific endopeptidase
MRARDNTTVEYELLYRRFRSAATEFGFPEEIVNLDKLEALFFDLLREGPPISVNDTLTKLAAVTNQVCEIRTKNPAGRLGTGFLVASDLILTASHVVANKPLANLQCLFNNIAFGSGAVLNNGPTPVEITKEEDSSPLALGDDVAEHKLDFSLLRLDTAVGDAMRKFITIRKNSTVEDDASVYVVEFPDAQSVSFAGGKVPKPFNSATEFAFHHNAQTSDGASGAPVFNNAFDLVGLHRGKVKNSTHNEAIDTARIFKQIHDNGHV